MKKTILSLTLLLACALPSFAQSSEFGVLVGGSRRSLKDSDPAAAGTQFGDDSFSFSKSAIDLYYGVELDPGTMFKLRVGRIETPVALRQSENGVNVRRDVDGEMQHAEGVVEYRFSESFGATGVFAGVGLNRHQAEDVTSKTNYGFVAGLNADLPLSRRYGVIVESAYYWTRGEYRPRYLTLSGGLRLNF